MVIYEVGLNSNFSEADKWGRQSPAYLKLKYR